MSGIQLTEGCLADIMKGAQLDGPIVQVLGAKKIVANRNKEKYRLLISDGKYHISFVVVATQINDIISKHVDTNCIIKIKQYITSMVNIAGKGDRRVMVILDLEVVKPAGEVGMKIGDPIALPDSVYEASMVEEKSKVSGSSTS